MHLFARGAVIAGVMGAAACGGTKPAPTADSAVPVAAEPSPPDAPVGDTIRVRLPGTTHGVTVLDAATVSGDSSVVFTFRADSTPGVEVFYADTPVTQCGSGDPVAMSGPAVLVVRFSPTDAHVFEGEEAKVTIVDRNRTLPGPLLTQMTMICDFEAQVEWALGLTQRVPFVVAAPSAGRIVLDLRR